MTEKIKFCLAVYGNPGNGKTFASKNLASKFNAQLIPFDEILNIISENLRRNFENKNIDFSYDYKNIFSTRENFNSFTNELDLLFAKEKNFFRKLYDNEIKDKKLLINYESGFDSTVINLGKIGDLLESFSENILKILVDIVLKNDFVIIDGYHFSDGKKYRNELAKLSQRISYLGCFFKQRETDSIYQYNEKKYNTLDEIERKLDIDLGKKKYQSFSKESYNSSFEKLEKLMIPDSLEGKIVLDLGCNEGFFSFESERRGAKVIGIEYSKDWYDLAQKRKNELSSFVNFYNDDWSILPTLNYQFDVVLFLAAFHYIKDNQLEILKNIYEKINDKGLLILELGLLNKNKDSFFIENVKRIAGDVCQFTNEFTIKKLLEDAGFVDIILIGKGTNIVGDDIPRYVIHAKKINSINSHPPEKVFQEFSIKSSKSKEISLYDVENLLISLYNTNKFYKNLFNGMYKILKLLHRK